MNRLFVNVLAIFFALVMVVLTSHSADSSFREQFKIEDFHKHSEYDSPPKDCRESTLPFLQSTLTNKPNLKI